MDTFQAITALVQAASALALVSGQVRKWAWKRRRCEREFAVLKTSVRRLEREVERLRAGQPRRAAARRL